MLSDGFLRLGFVGPCSCEVISTGLSVRQGATVPLKCNVRFGRRVCRGVSSTEIAETFEVGSIGEERAYARQATGC